MILSRVESLINGHLATDPDLQEKVRAMAGKALLIELTGVELSLWLLPTETDLAVQSSYAGEADVTIKGSPLALMKLARSPSESPASFNGEVVISGDLALGQHVQRLLKDLDLDWEELLAQRVGDVAAHQIGNLFRGMQRWLGETRESMERNTGEYLRIEAEMTPQRFEVDSFIEGVDDLRSDVDRLEQRLLRLKAGQS